MRHPGISSLLFLFLSLLSTVSYGQRETTFWFFGNRAGLFFPNQNAGPIYQATSTMKALEGCATISDSLGGLLLYTAGDTVFNRFHQKMNNGWPLTGHQSASQSSIIVEQPYTNLHYLFAVDALGGQNSLKYSVVNANANNFAGTVLAKNIAVPGAGPAFPVSEKITAVDHRHTRDVWIIAHGSGTQNDKFYAYRLTANGIMPPVVSQVGISHAGSFPNNKTIGYMKVSPDGRKLALAMQEQHLVELYDFNDSSGVVSNPVRFLGLPRAYGVEFSRNSDKLYVSVQGPTAQVEQFNLEAGGGHPDSIRISRKTAGITKSVYSAALQLALNGRIYVANTDLPPGNRFLSVINRPDSAAKDVSFTVNTQVISPTVNGPQRSNQGLPNFNQSYLWLPSFRARNLCVGSHSLFTLLTKRKFKSVLWNFSDPNSANNTSTDLNPTHQFTAPGTYQVSLTVTLLNNRVRAIIMPVIIRPLPKVNLGYDQKICSNGSILLQGPGGKDKHLWSNGSTDTVLTVTQPGIYWLEVRNKDNCSFRDSIVIYPAPAPNYIYNKVVETCPFRPVTLRCDYKNTTYLWSTGSTDSAITVSRSGWYTVTLMHDGCPFTDSMQVVYKTCPEDFRPPNIITPNGDDRNDKFEFWGYPAGAFSLRMFNRWGTLIYETDNYQNDWPQQKPPAGTYYYQLQHLENKQLYKGWLEVTD